MKRINHRQNKFRNLSLADLKKFFPILMLLLALYCLPTVIKAQSLDNMTNEEDSLIRDTDEIDERMNVYVHIVDRRFMALTDPAADQSKQAQKDLEKYGKLRTGTPAKLYADIERTISEVIGKLDDVAERDQKNPLFPKSVRILTKACQRWIPQFKTAFDKAADDAEKIPITNAIEECNEVITASTKLPKEDPQTDKKKKSKDDSN